eukprot:tig00000241_g20866.t1
MRLSGSSRAVAQRWLLISLSLIAVLASSANAFTFTIQGFYTNAQCTNASSVTNPSLLKIMPRFGPMFFEIESPTDCLRPADVHFHAGLEPAIVSAEVNFKRRNDGSLGYLFAYQTGWMQARCVRPPYGVMIAGQLVPTFYEFGSGGACSDATRVIDIGQAAVINQCIPYGCLESYGCLYARVGCYNVTNALTHTTKLVAGGMDRVVETPPPTPTPSPTPAPVVEEVWPEFTSTLEGFFTAPGCPAASRLRNGTLLARFPTFGPAFTEIDRDTCTATSSLLEAAGMQTYFDALVAGRAAGELEALGKITTGSFRAVCKKLPGRLIRGVFDVQFFESGGGSCVGAAIPVNVDGQCIPLGCLSAGAAAATAGNGTAAASGATCLYLRAGCANITLTESPPLLPASGVSVSAARQPALALTFSDTVWAARLTTCPENRVPWCPSGATWSCTPGASLGDVVSARCFGADGAEVFPQRTVKKVTMSIKLTADFMSFLDAYGGKRDIFAPGAQEARARDVVYAQLDALFNSLAEGGKYSNPDQDPAAPWNVESVSAGSVLLTLGMRATFSSVALALFKRFPSTFMGLPVVDLRDANGDSVSRSEAVGTVKRSRLAAASLGLPVAPLAAGIAAGCAALLGAGVALWAWRRRRRAGSPREAFSSIEDGPGSARRSSRVAPPAPV